MHASSSKVFCHSGTCPCCSVQYRPVSVCSVLAIISCGHAAAPPWHPTQASMPPVAMDPGHPPPPAPALAVAHGGAAAMVAPAPGAMTTGSRLVRQLASPGLRCYQRILPLQSSGKSCVPRCRSAHEIGVSRSGFTIALSEHSKSKPLETGKKSREDCKL